MVEEKFSGKGNLRSFRRISTSAIIWPDICLSNPSRTVSTSGNSGMDGLNTDCPLPFLTLIVKNRLYFIQGASEDNMLLLKARNIYSL